ncbi:MAG: YdiU family protein [Litoreibacter sp.]|nr:YdiU family protein [Litoreibacter sp.]
MTADSVSGAAPVFDNSYAALPERFYTKLDPAPVAEPALIALNEGLAEEMGLDTAWLRSEAGLAMFAGNRLPEGAEPLTQVYAGHQFGGWSPQLGDGRANLIGEIAGPDGRHWDIQLKGSGQTPYSRMGDGRAWLGPVLREYIVSEAMHAFGVPTTRALAAVSTGERVLREAPFPGAFLTRVAPSHVRVGTFQYFAARQDTDALEHLCEFTLARHYPEATGEGALGLLRSVTRVQARLVAQWMGLGFIHGVMNTDNAHMGGLTIDYGPCAFMDSYNPAQVFSSIDQFGRYAYQAQPEILVWNLAQLASSLLPLMDADQDKAVAQARNVLHGFGAAYTEAWTKIFLAKIGLREARDGDIALVQDLLGRMAEGDADFTLTFRALAGLDTATARALFSNSEQFDDWAERWQARLSDEPGEESEKTDRMRLANPAFIPRNHRIEEAIQFALAGDYGPFERLVSALATPFEDQPAHVALQQPPAEDEIVRQTFCGT